MTDDVKKDDLPEDKKEEIVEKKEVKQTKDEKDDDTIKWRSKYKVTKEELETIKAKSDLEKQELSSKVESTHKERQMFEQKYIEAEVKAYAVAAGIKDIEFVKLIDKADIKLDEKGNITGVEKAITDLKSRKPDWFGSEKKVSSSSNQPFPEKSEKTPADARNMSKEEWNKVKGRAMAGQF